MSEPINAHVFVLRWVAADPAANCLSCRRGCQVARAARPRACGMFCTLINTRETARKQQDKYHPLMRSSAARSSANACGYPQTHTHKHTQKRTHARTHAHAHTHTITHISGRPRRGTTRSVAFHVQLLRELWIIVLCVCPLRMSRKSSASQAMHCIAIHCHARGTRLQQSEGVLLLILLGTNQRSWSTTNKRPVSSAIHRPCHT